MATKTITIGMGSKRLGGGRQVTVAPGGTADLSVTVNLSTVKDKSDFMRLCEEVASQLSGDFK